MLSNAKRTRQEAIGARLLDIGMTGRRGLVVETEGRVVTGAIIALAGAGTGRPEVKWNGRKV